MHLNHLDLPVPDVAATAAFFTTHFGFVLRETRGNDAFALLQDAHGFVLVLTRRRTEGAQAFPENFHIGFLLDSEAGVHAAHAGRRPGRSQLPGSGPAAGPVNGAARRRPASTSSAATPHAAAAAYTAGL